MCLGLEFTFPILVHPVRALKLDNDDAESLIRRLGKFRINISRTVLVIAHMNSIRITLSNHRSELDFFPGISDAIVESTRTSGRDRDATIQHEILRVAKAIQRAAVALKGEII
ncbi:hypothetical protein V6N11_040166 [Hibiscus sabdariffa]|uniref:Uncharacterized protein n=1 Tax=Hibiscus sabdariffa TaxID=183260 RepID=A0ABR2RHB4_9ROSI